jgi:hypothetical protein
MKKKEQLINDIFGEVWHKKKEMDSEDLKVFI